jgi:signal transduction histidine kinase
MLFVDMFCSLTFVCILLCVLLQGQLINKKSFVRYVSHEIRTPLNTGTSTIKAVFSILILTYYFVVVAVVVAATPCSFVVYLGIQLLAAELKEMSDKQKSDYGAKLQEIVHDISESCSISISILNDLLLIDKIEEGNLNLDMKPENAKDLFEPCIRNFDVQVLLL